MRSRIILPSIDEKKKIAEIVVPQDMDEQKQIRELFSSLDNLIALQQHKIEELKKYKKALTQLLLTGIMRVLKMPWKEC